MSVNLQGSFDFILDLKGKNVQLKDVDNDITIPVKAAQSNYFRNFTSAEELIVPGREFVISNTDIKGSAIPVIEEKMRLIDGTQEFIITEIREMAGLKGEFSLIRV